MKIKNIAFLALFVSLSVFSFGQEEVRSITVSGKKTYNLSPNEIIISINYEEYFKGGVETWENKVPMEEIEPKVIQSLLDAGVKRDKITMGEVRIVRAHKNAKRRLNKGVSICIYNIEEYIQVIRQLEKDELLDGVISTFSVAQYKHTEKEKYLRDSRAEAYADAKNKAELILSQSGEKLGRVIKITELGSGRNNSNGGFYSTDNSPQETVSGFKPVVISYNLEVVFEIKD